MVFGSRNAPFDGLEVWRSWAAIGSESSSSIEPTVAYSRIINGQQEALVAAFRDEEWSIVGGSVEGARPRRVRRLDEGFWLEGQQSSEGGQRTGVGWYAGPDDISSSFESSDDDLSTDSRWNADWSWSVWTVDGELWLERRKSGAEEE